MLGFLRDYIIYLWNVLFRKSQPVSGSLTSSGNSGDADCPAPEGKEQLETAPVVPEKELTISKPVNESSTSVSKSEPELKQIVDQTPILPIPIEPKVVSEFKTVTSATKQTPPVTAIKSEPEKPGPLFSDNKQSVSPAVSSEKTVPFVETKSIPANIEIKVKPLADAPTKPADPPFIPVPQVEKKNREESYDFEDDLDIDEEVSDEELNEKVKNYLKAVQEQEHHDKIKKHPKSEEIIDQSDPEKSEEEIIEDITSLDDEEDDIEKITN